jgi:hypothetical protein
MKLVSFDIGLRNLAFCILEGTNRSNLKITHWDLIDVMAESAGHDNPKCHKCKKPANWVRQETYSCGRHKGSDELKSLPKKEINKRPVESLRALCRAAGIRGTTKKELVDGYYLYLKSNTWVKCVKSTKQVSVVDLAGPIAQCLEARKSIWNNADLICFEQQPDKRMLCVQAMMHMWFVCSGFHCKGVSATHKLTNIVTVQDATTTYKGRKKTGILHAQQLVPENWKNYMMSHPKKDDLADCFLQGLWILENSRLT